MTQTTFASGTVRDFTIFSREHKDFFATVSRVGSSAFGSWGYVIWRSNEALMGAKDWNWTADDACAQADRAMNTLILAHDGG